MKKVEFFVIAVLFFFNTPFLASADTVVNPNINTDTHWTADQSPYIISTDCYSAVTVFSGVTLTIEPGTIVKFGSNCSAMNIQGILNAVGTDSNPIYFTSIKDDTVGGDTDLSTTTIPSAGNWREIIIDSGATTTLDHVFIKYGGNNLNDHGSGANIYNNGGNLTITNSTIASSYVYGVYGNSGQTIISTSTIKDNGFGVSFGGLESDITLNGNTFSKNIYLAGVFLSPKKFVHFENSAYENGLNGFNMVGSVSSDQTWSGGDNVPYIIGRDVVGDYYTPWGISQGVTLTIEPGSIIKFKNADTYVDIQGTLNAVGTEDKPIYFTSIKDDTVGGDTDGIAITPSVGDWREIDVNSGATMTFDHVFVKYGGNNFNDHGSGANILNNGGSLNITNSTVSSSNYYDILVEDGITNISSSSIIDSFYGVYVRSIADTVDARNNWWGDASGPFHLIFNPSGKGSRVFGNVNFAPWLTSESGIVPPENKLTPVLFVPGTLGTEIKKGDEVLWLDIPKLSFTPFDRFMDPLSFNPDGTPSDTSLVIGKVLDKPFDNFLGQFDYTEGLVSEFVYRGYSTSTNFFLFPYDWRGDISDNADINLKNKIDTILNQTSEEKIDIIAHSQGGLLVKKLLLDHPEYASKIRKIVFLGTPNLGSPSSSKVLLEGDSLGILWRGVGLDSSEVKRISQNMPSIYEMLPSQEYFSHLSGYLGETKWNLFSTDEDLVEKIVYDYDTTKQKLIEKGLNSSLISLAENFHTNALDNLDLSNLGIETWNIVGCQTPTLTQTIKLSPWFNDVVYGLGDGTVPLASATNIGVTNILYSLDAEHGKMPSNSIIRGQIADILTGTTDVVRTGLTTNTLECHLNGREVSVHSPADLNVYDPQGRHLGYKSDGSFDNEIPGVAYDTIGEEKFAFLPELPNGENYTVKLVATGSGNMSFISKQIEEGKTIKTATYFDIPIAISSQAEILLNNDNSQTLILNTNGNIQNITPVATQDNTFPDVLTPKTEISINGTKGENNYFLSDVSVSFSATDLPIAVSSGVKETKYLLDNNTWQTYFSTSPITITTEGDHILKYYSVDVANNQEATSTITIKIDKTAPEAKILVDTITKDLKIEGADISGIESVNKDINNNYIITDNAGHTTKLIFSKNYFGKILTYAKLTGVQYDNSSIINLPSSYFVYVWQLILNPATLLSQTIYVNNTYWLQATYDKKNNKTIVVTIQKGKVVKKQEFSSLRVIKLTTNNGVIGYEI
ncbi:MAG: hypothetical protein WCW87_00825 [Candidatus Paceibacterota bacterium]